jgi:hypothetical protein
MPRTAFFAYPGQPAIVGEAVSEALPVLQVDRQLILTPWSRLEVQGLKIDDLIRDRILAQDFLAADITYPNFNVYYEIGYAIGSSKPVVLSMNYAVEKAAANVNLTGLFDTIGQTKYQNGRELAERIATSAAEPLANHYIKDKDYNQPLFILDTLHKIEFRNYIIQSVENSSVHYRSYDPDEVARLSLQSAVGHISSSAGVIIPLLSTEIAEWQRHNLHAAFLAGLCHGFGIEPLIIQYDDGPAPLDYRDYISTTESRRGVEQLVTDYCQQTLVKNQQRTAIAERKKKSLLDDIDIGASAAENEYQKLGKYFVRTAQFARALRANSGVVTGRKGSGKSAIFYQIIEQKSDKQSVVVELSPATHSLSELRLNLVASENVGVFDHTIAAFWQYILYAEIALSIRQVILPKAKYHLPTLKEVESLEKRFKLTEEMVAGDFTARMEIAVQTLLTEISSTDNTSKLKERLTNILFEKEIGGFRDAIASIGKPFERIVLLFDNLDKGWPPRRVEPHDIRTVQHLIDALNKIQRELERRDVTFQYLLFLRSDVFETLVQETADRGKYNDINVDWTDPEQLEHLIRERVVSAVEDEKAAEAWEAVNPVVDGKSAVRTAIEASLMRPRFLIDLFERAISFAINRGHKAISREDLTGALEQHSRYLVSDFGFELRDVSGLSEKIFDGFLGKGTTLTAAEVVEIVAKQDRHIPAKDIVDLLVWYGFLGVPDADNKPVYIYERNYDMRRLEALQKNQGDDLLYTINPAFLVGLEN